MLRAACRNMGPDLFHNDDRKARGAKAFCSGCEVKEECLNYALAQHIHEGVWGGMTGTERQSYRRRIARRKALNVVQMGD
jgi:WhiB family redox-sensing transcriptional regulator